MKNNARHRASSPKQFRFRAAAASIYRAAIRCEVNGCTGSLGRRAFQCLLLASGILAWHLSGSMPLPLGVFGQWAGMVAGVLGYVWGDENASPQTARPSTVVARSTTLVCLAAASIAGFAQATGLFE